MNRRPEPVEVVRTSADGICVLYFTGVLDGTTYRHVRDTVVKAALDEPRAVVIDVSGLQVPAPSAWSVFTSARWLVGEWPVVPLALACSDAAGRKTLLRQGIPRYVPVHDTVPAAVDAALASKPPVRHRARERWPAEPSAVPAAQRFVAHWLNAWSRQDMAVTASVIATVLVDNVLRHAGSDPDLRLEASDDTVTVAVTDRSTQLAALHEDEFGVPRFTELQVVQALSRVWGNTSLADGKVVWAVIGPENRL